MWGREELIEIFISEIPTLPSYHNRSEDFDLPQKPDRSESLEFSLVNELQSLACSLVSANKVHDHLSWAKFLHNENKTQRRLFVSLNSV